MPIIASYTVFSPFQVFMLIFIKKEDIHGNDQSIFICKEAKYQLVLASQEHISFERIWLGFGLFADNTSNLKTIQWELELV